MAGLRNGFCARHLMMRRSPIYLRLKKLNFLCVTFALLLAQTSFYAHCSDLQRIYFLWTAYTLQAKGTIQWWCGVQLDWWIEGPCKWTCIPYFLCQTIQKIAIFFTCSWFDFITFTPLEFHSFSIHFQVSGSMMTNASFVYPENTPTTKEAYYYRTIFEKFFPKVWKLLSTFALTMLFWAMSFAL